MGLQKQLHKLIKTSAEYISKKISKWEKVCPYRQAHKFTETSSDPCKRTGVGVRSLQTKGQTGGHDEANSPFRNFANTPKNWNPN
jgi:hypothetical protein